MYVLVKFPIGIKIIYPEDIYSMNVTPLDFILYLKKPPNNLTKYGLESQKINRNWISFYDVVILTPYLADRSKCPEVIDVVSSVSLGPELSSTVNKEVEKILNFYYKGYYLTKF